MSAFIVSMDGPDYSGKSTISNLVLNKLRQECKDCRLKHTILPSDLVTGSFTKILRSMKDDTAPEVYALTYATDHLYHNLTTIKPLIESKNKYIVILERSLLSSIIYQSQMQGVDRKWLDEINKHVRFLPNLTIILKISPEEIIKRKSIEQREFDSLEKESFLKRQVELYNNIPADLVKKFNVKWVNAERSVDEIVDEICAMVVSAVR